MDEHSRQARKVAARVLPVARLELPRTLTRPARVPGTPAAAPAAPATPVRAYGAPLAAASRMPASLRKAAQRLGRTTGDDTTASLPLPLDRPAPGSADVDEAAARDETAPLILWEQPPLPRAEVDSRPAPRWMIDPAVKPDALQLSTLATQVGAILGGFADFARTAAVIENGNWHARLPMPQAVLPETALDMQVSSSQAKLRFETEHPVSREVLALYRSELQRQVTLALGDARVVEVTLW